MSEQASESFQCSLTNFAVDAGVGENFCGGIEELSDRSGKAVWEWRCGAFRAYRLGQGRSGRERFEVDPLELVLHASNYDRHKIDEVAQVAASGMTPEESGKKGESGHQQGGSRGAVARSKGPNCSGADPVCFGVEATGERFRSLSQQDEALLTGRD